MIDSGINWSGSEGGWRLLFGGIRIDNSKKFYTSSHYRRAQNCYFYFLSDWLDECSAKWCRCVSALPGAPLRLSPCWFRPNLVEIWLGLCPAICHRSTGCGGLPVPSLPKLSMAFGTYFIWMSGHYKWREMDILWILWTIPAVIAVEGKLIFWSTGSQSHPRDDSGGFGKRSRWPLAVFFNSSK